MGQKKYEGYVGAPYNFVGLSDRVYKKDKLQPINVIEKERKSGTITYEITAKTPIFIDNGESELRSICHSREYHKGAGAFKCADLELLLCER